MSNPIKQKLKSILILLLVILLSSVAGGSFAIHKIRTNTKEKNFMIQNGCWSVNPKMDLTDRYQRALISMIGLFALRESEVLYFIASQDSDGQPLSSEYNYILEGTAPDTRYWSYTLYGEDYFLVKNEANKFGFNLNNIQYLPDSSNLPELPKNTRKNHQISISSEPKGDNWLPCGNEQQFYINLRMYNPSPSVYQHLESVYLPKIKRVEQ